MRRTWCCNARLTLSEPAMPFEQFAMQARWTFEADNMLQVELDKLDFDQQGLRVACMARTACRSTARTWARWT
jgi:hypothetical protein